VAESGRRRKYYRITADGRKHLAEQRQQWLAVDATLREIWDARTDALATLRTVPVPSTFTGSVTHG